MSERIRQEVEGLACVYPGARYDEEKRLVIVPDFPLPPGWNRSTTTLTVLVPPTYPETPPDNFYVDKGLRLSDGGMPENYREDGNIPVLGCGVFSWHPEGAWKPSASVEDGDNLKAFLWSVRCRLRQGR